MRAKLRSLETFCLTVELGGFTAAAKALGITPQAASRSVSRLEVSIGAVLFRRNTRHVEPTDAGRQYYESARIALQTLADAESRITEDEPAGDVRISVPTTYGHHRFLPLLADFQRAFPRIHVEVEVDNRNIDFVRGGFDLAIRMGTLDDASFIARRLGDFPLGVYGSPDYLARAGTPTSPADLADHACAVFVMPRTGRSLPWTFDPGPERHVPYASVRIRHDPLGLVSYARAGGGLIQFYSFLVEAEVARGELQEVLGAYRGRARPFSLIYPRDAVGRLAVRTLVDHIVAGSAPDRSV
ncbi:MAG: DNA-binding transcriptional LysR family regulator [Myxococcota bacterium]|jgi:DNA-binding transcriptional LysR family regulator